MSNHRVPDVSAVTSPPRRNITKHDISVGDQLGTGGQAVVYEAQVSGEPSPDRIALKEPLHSNTLTEEVAERFLAEASTWETIDSRERQKPRWRDFEHIVGVIDTGEQLPWIALEYMDGGSLEDRLAAAPDGLPIEEALWIGETVCQGVEIAHNSGVAHFDLKPANVLFRETTDETWDVPKVADWGLARVLAEESGSMDAFSVEYAAPEQFDSSAFGDPDMLTDIYQVGALVYAMLTGDPPYTGSNRSIMLDIVSDENPVPPSTRRGELPSEVDAVVLRALETNKTERYSSISILRQALRSARTGKQSDSSGHSRGTDMEQSTAGMGVTDSETGRAGSKTDREASDGDPAQYSSNTGSDSDVGERNDPEERAETDYHTHIGTALHRGAKNGLEGLNIGEKEAISHAKAIDTALNCIVQDKSEVEEFIEALQEANRTHRNKMLRLIRASDQFLDELGGDLEKHSRDLQAEAEALSRIKEEIEVVEWSESEEDALRRFEETAYGAFTEDKWQGNEVDRSISSRTTDDGRSDEQNMDSFEDISNVPSDGEYLSKVEFLLKTLQEDETIDEEIGGLVLLLDLSEKAIDRVRQHQADAGKDMSNIPWDDAVRDFTKAHVALHNLRDEISKFQYEKGKSKNLAETAIEAQEQVDSVINNQLAEVNRRFEQEYGYSLRDRMEVDTSYPSRPNTPEELVDDLTEKDQNSRNS